MYAHASPKIVPTCQITTPSKSQYQPELLYRAFHNILRDYKHFQQENQRTYLSGIVHSHRNTEKVFFFF